MRGSNLLRKFRDLALNLFTPSFGTVIAESGFYNLFHPQTQAGRYAKELVLSGSIAFLLGCLVYFKFGSRTSLRVWLLGLAGFVWWIVPGREGVSLYEPQRATLSFVSLRLVAYSAGAIFWARAIKTVSRPEQRN